jgi:uncharacterized cupredoxin-like copper-binding protein
MRTATLLCAGALLAACAAPPEREIVIAMVEYGFIPPRIEIATGERVRLQLRNAGFLEHDFSAGQKGVALGLGHVHLRPNTTSALDWTAPVTPDEIRVICTVTGHEQLGMTATLAVTRRASPVP